MNDKDMNDKRKTGADSRKSAGAKSAASAIKTTVNAAKSATYPRITPLGDRVLIKPFLDSDLETKNDFGIIIPDTVSKERPEQGKIVAIGEGRYEDGKLVPMKVRVGDKVIFSKYGFDEVKVGSDELYILKEESILAIIR